MSYWEPTFEIQARGNSSPESQIEYLKKVVQAKQYEVNSLQNHLDALKLEHSIERKQFEDAIHAIKLVQLRYATAPRFKRRWWEFWKR